MTEAAILEQIMSSVPSPHDSRFSWQEEAPCRDVDPEIFFPRTSYAAAQRVCQGCPVQRECREWCDVVEAGVGRSQLFGFFGGEMPEERFARRQTERAAVA